MSTRIPEEVIEKIRMDNEIVDVVEDYVQLTKKGRNYVGLCPFHDEKTPSFSVTKEKQIFHCFGCGKGGNVITFVSEIEKVPFMDALKILAERINYQLPIQATNEPKLSKEANELLSAFDWLTKYYHHLLKYSKDGSNGLQYAYERNMSDETIDEFQLGYAPTDSELTIQFLKQKGFHEQTLLKAGLLSSTDNINYHDIFRGRVIFPIHNHSGHVVAFGGRSIDGREPKYLNSSEHELFKKGHLLYNFHKARPAIRKQNEVIIFEGYMDVIAAVQSGISNSVATLGTALTEQQGKLLKRYVNNVIICYDGDDAGQNAAYNATLLLNQIGCQVRIARIKNNLDPDDYIKKYGGEKFKQQVLATSDTFFGFYMNYTKNHYKLSVDSERIAYIENLMKELAKLTSSIERDYYINEIAEQFNLSQQIIAHDVEQQRKRLTNRKDKSANNRYTNKAVTFTNKREFEPAYFKAERHLIAHMLQHKHIVDKVRDRIGINCITEEHQVILTHLYGMQEEKGYIDVSQLIDNLSEENYKKIITDIAMLEINNDVTDDEINDYLKTIEIETIKKTDLNQLKQKLATETNPIIAAQIGLQIIELEQKLKNG